MEARQRPGSLAHDPVEAVAVDETAGGLEDLKRKITDYYQTYYQELLSRLSSYDGLNSYLVPEHLKGYRRVITQLGDDGAVVTHWPEGQDAFDFHLSPGKPVRDLVTEQCGGQEILEYEPGEDFGVLELDEPLQLEMDGRTVWTSGWTRMEVTSRLDIWDDPALARKAAVETLSPYASSGCP